MKPPARYKTAILIWLALYPCVNLVFYFLGGWLQTLPLLLRTLVLTLILVPTVVFVLLPLLSKMFKEWLHR